MNIFNGTRNELHEKKNENIIVVFVTQKTRNYDHQKNIFKKKKNGEVGCTLLYSSRVYLIIE